MTRRGIERARFLAFTQMTRNGASNTAAFQYIDLVHPLEPVRPPEEVVPDDMNAQTVPTAP